MKTQEILTELYSLFKNENHNGAFIQFPPRTRRIMELLRKLNDTFDLPLVNLEEILMDFVGHPELSDETLDEALIKLADAAVLCKTQSKLEEKNGDDGTGSEDRSHSHRIQCEEIDLEDGDDEILNRSIEKAMQKIKMNETVKNQNDENSKTETHPFGAYIPENTQYLLLGSFPCKNKDGNYGQWFYCGSGRNLFWELFEAVYEADLQSLISKKQLLTSLGIAITDVAKVIRRKSEDRKLFCKDTNLEIIKLNSDEIRNILETRAIQKIYFTSKYVADVYCKLIKPVIDAKNIPTITLLSPSPQAAIAYSTRQDVIGFLRENSGKKIKDFIINQYKTELPKR